MLSQDPSSITKPSFYANKRNLSDFNYDNGRSTNGGDDGCIQKTLAPPSSSLSNNNNAANDNVGMRKRINLTNSTNDNVLFASTNNDGYKQETHFESNERHHFPHHPSIVDEIIVAKDVRTRNESYTTSIDSDHLGTTEMKENGNGEVNDGNNNVEEEVVEEEVVEEEEEEDPDWEMIAQHEPAKYDIPRFLDARSRRMTAEDRFASALDDAHACLKQCSDELLKTAADLFNVQKEKVLAMEVQLKQDFVENEHARSQMQTKLEESASVAQEQFKQLMMRVTQLNKGLNGIGASAGKNLRNKK